MPTKAELAAADRIELPDLFRPGLRLLLVGVRRFTQLRDAVERMEVLAAAGRLPD